MSSLDMFTIDDDAMVAVEDSGEDSDADDGASTTKILNKAANREKLSSGFHFDEADDDEAERVRVNPQSWDFMAAAKKGTAPRGGANGKTTLDEKISQRLARKRLEALQKNRGAKAPVASKGKASKDSSEDEDEDGDSEEGGDSGDSEDGDDVERRYERRGDDDSDDDDHDDDESDDAEDDMVGSVGSVAAKKSKGFDAAGDLRDARSAAYFADAAAAEDTLRARTHHSGKAHTSGSGTFDPRAPDGGASSSAAEGSAGDGTFEQLHLSRPLLRAIRALGFVSPTPIQVKAIPIALAGRDICGSAMTGSGKTAAFLLPLLERLQFRNRNTPATRVLIVMPTRELAAQCQAMMTKLAQFTDITSALVVGGLSIAIQAVELRKRPDVVICTPGRMIDHLRNSQSVDLDDVEVLVLDEADRLLEFGFEDEVREQEESGGVCVSGRCGRCGWCGRCVCACLCVCVGSTSADD